MPANIIQPTSNQNKTSIFRRIFSNHWLDLVILLVALLAATGAYYLQSHKNKAPSTPAQTTHYNISQTKDFSLSQSKVGNGATFKKPDGFEPIKAPDYKEATSQVLLARADAARIGLAAVSFNPPTPDYLANFAKTISNPKGPNYETLLKPAKDFVSQRLPAGYSLAGLSVPQPLSTPNVTNNMWVAGISASNSANPPGFVAGQIVIAYGKQTVYYFMVQNKFSEWQANGAFWWEIINSLKIDQ